MKISLDKISSFLFILLGIVILTFPRFFQIEKTVLLFGLLAIGIYQKILISKVKVNSFIFLWYFGYLAFAFIWSLFGLLKGNPGAGDAFRLEFVWILILFLFTVVLTIDTRTIKRTIYLSSFFTSVVGLYFILEPTFGQIFIFSWIPFNHVRNINGLIRTNLPNIAFMSFLFPVLIFLKFPEKGAGRLFVIMVIISSALFVFLSGRRIIQMVVLLSILTFLLSKIRRIYIKPFVITSVSIVLVLLLFQYLNSKYSFVDLKLYYQMYIKGMLDNYKNDIRYQQLIEFWRYTKDNLLFGVGFGKGIPTIIRDVNMPWRYELTYSMYLYQTGLIGMTFFIGLFTLLFIKLRSYFNVGKAMAMGLLFYLMASGTNPYITSGFDYKFPLLILMLFIAYESKQCLNE